MCNRASFTPEPKYVFIAQEVAWPQSLLDNFSKYHRIDTFQAVVVMDPLFLSNHPSLSANTANRRVQPPSITTVIFNVIESLEQLFVEVIVRTHPHDGEIVQL